jgi:Ankyrin repeats (3 copies)
LAQKCVSNLYRTFSTRPQPIDVEALRNTFTAYAAENWPGHFLAAQDLADEEFLDSVRSLFQAKDSPLASWLSLYEAMTSETLPRREIFGPLFGGAYFGLDSIVREALKNGADIDADDQSGKTPLHWASERGHLGIVRLLIEHHANTEAQDHEGLTSLHRAVQAGNFDIVSELVNAHVDANKPTFDQRTPLHLAVESKRTDIVQFLLDAGCDATSNTTNGFNAFQLAAQADKKGMLNVLMLHEAAAENLLNSSILNNSTQSLILLLEHRKDVVTKRYPWVSDLLDENCSLKEISELVTKSENLHWETSDWVVPNKPDWPDLSWHPHETACAHSIVSRNLTASTTSQLSDNNTKDDDNPFVKPTGDTQHFENLEEREQHLIRICGIAGVFPPYVAVLNPGSAFFQGGLATIAYGESDIVSVK